MSLFNAIFNKGSNARKTGVYKVIGESLVELEHLEGNGSINSIIEQVGYQTAQIHTVILFDSKNIDTIGFKILTRDPVFIVTSSDVTGLHLKDARKQIGEIDWDHEYSATAIEDILNEGIAQKSLSLDYLFSVTALENESPGIFLAKKLGLYLYFENNVLSSYSSSDWFSAESKWLRELNGEMFLGILKEAKAFHGNDLEAYEEVNIQCRSLHSVPNAMRNEFLEIHRNATNNVNFYNLLLAHHNGSANINEFELVNRGRYRKIGIESFEVGVFQYHFSGGELESVTRKN